MGSRSDREPCGSSKAESAAPPYTSRSGGVHTPRGGRCYWTSYKKSIHTVLRSVDAYGIKKYPLILILPVADAHLSGLHTLIVSRSGAPTDRHEALLIKIFLMLLVQRILFTKAPTIASQSWRQCRTLITHAFCPAAAPYHPCIFFFGTVCFVF